MSALGHKRTYAVQKAMSALPPKADIASYFLGVIGVEARHKKANGNDEICVVDLSQPRRGVLRLDRCSERVELRRVMNPDLKANFIAEL
jgi:hypothetical protein